MTIYAKYSVNPELMTEKKKQADRQSLKICRKMFSQQDK